MIRFILRPLPALRAFVAGLLLLGGSAAWSAAVTQAFTLTPDFFLNFNGTPSGSFTFDDAVPLTATLQGDFTRPLTAFSVQIGSDSIALGNVDGALAVFDATGLFTGLAVSDDLLTMNPAVGQQAAFFSYASGDSLASGAVTFAPPGTVPAPATWALALLALAAVRPRARRA